MTLADWLEFQQRQHPRSIALGLDRIQAVAGRLEIGRPASRVVTIAGTNGKGSCVAMLESMLRAGARRVGAYTSPHLLRYNERVRIDGKEAGDAELVAAFEAIEAVRGEIPLTCFEYGTLAALRMFSGAGLDVALLEVGLGGRLDAVNIVDADVALLTGIALDHQEWLGADRESIGREKAGVFRAGRTAVLADPDPPASVLAHAAELGVDLRRPGRDYRFAETADGLEWQGRGGARVTLPRPPLAAPVQVANAAACLAVLEALGERALIDHGDAARGLAAVQLQGRLQRLARDPDVMVDVAHNPQAAQQLVDWLGSQPQRRSVALFAALDDKDAAAMVAALAPHIDEWHFAGLHRLSPRGLRAAVLFNRCREALRGGVVALHPDPAAALVAARESAGKAGRVLVFGSFITVEAVMRAVHV